MKLLKTMVFAAVLLAIGFALGTGFLDDSSRADTPMFTAPEQTITAQPIQQTVADSPYLNDQERTIAGIYEEVSPSVVSISVIRSSSGTFGGESGGSGTGFVIDRSGHIVTNFHVVEGSIETRVRFQDGTITRAETVGLDPDSDIAVIKVDLPVDRLRPVTFGNVNELVIGQSVVAIGSPFGQDWTLTSGIISALNRNLDGLGDYSIGSAIQTDAPINPGNSGGPLVNMRGQVIGVNSQIISETRSNSGIGFAVPSDLVQRVASELVKTGEVSYSVMGIQGGDVSLEVMESLDLPNDQRGVVVSNVLAGSPAAEAGLRNPEGDASMTRLESADIITAIDGRQITGINGLISHLARFTRPGDIVDLTVLRDGREITLPLTLGRRGE